MRRIEAEDPQRQLVGLDHRLKGENRLKEKVADELDARPGLAATQALASVPDSVRFTFCYGEERYASGVRADLSRLHAEGFELAKPLKNSWANDQYRGINTQWLEPDRTALRGAIPHAGELRGQAAFSRYIRENPESTDP